MSPHNRQQRRQLAHVQAGFTIIELLIATVIFSVILLIITASILQFSKQYYRGIVASSTQGVTRTLIDEVTRAIEFNSGSVTQLTAGGTTGWCVGTSKRYSYVLNKEVTDSGSLGSSQSRHGVVSDAIAGCNTATPALAVAGLGTLSTPDARELLGQHMRLTKFTILDKDPLYTITVRVVYGDDDLLTSPTNPNAQCLSGSGSQFCATSELTTTVRKRVP